MRIKLNEFVRGQKIEGIGAFNLSNGINDPSLVREPLYYEMATALGLKAPRTNYAALYINDEYYGIYVLGEVVNSDFLKNYFGKGEDTGNLYKGNIGSTFADLGQTGRPPGAPIGWITDLQSNGYSQTKIREPQPRELPAGLMSPTP